MKLLPCRAADYIRQAKQTQAIAEREEERVKAGFESRRLKTQVSESGLGTRLALFYARTA